MESTNILIIDDSPVDRKIMRKVICNGISGVSIIENEDGKGILPLIRKNSIKLVILDSMLPGISGIQILEEIRSDFYFQDIPVIVCSGLDEEDVIKKTLSLGAFDFFEKPLSDRAVKFLMALKVRNGLELVRRAEEADFLRDHDPISQLNTRQYFEYNFKKYDRLDYYPLTFLMLDIDGLKIFNDAYGRSEGDRVIKAVGSFLIEHAKNLHICSRWGSDEFLLLLSDYPQQMCEELVGELKNYLDNVEDFHGINISFGLEVVEEASGSELLPIQKAEEHLYSNKIISSKSIRSQMLESIRQTLHEKNPREERHSKRVSEISEIIARELGFSEFEVKKISMAGLMHDIGKISVDESILNKPGNLHREEWEAIKKHPEMGYRILSASTDTVDIAKAVLTHHERYDGKGYPQSLSGEDIPLLGRLICVADSFDAMTGPRTYKAVFSMEKAVGEIVKNSGTQFDPTIVAAFIQAVDKGLISV